MMMKEVLNALSNNSFINKYELDDEKSLAWVETTKMCKDGFPFEVLIDFDGNQDVVTVAHIFRIPLADNFFSKCSTISLLMANQLNIWLAESGCYPGGCFSLSFAYGKESAFSGDLTYCNNIHREVDLPTMIRTMSCSIKALIEIVDNIETFIEKTRRTPELLEVDDGIWIDKINEKISDSEMFERNMIWALHPAFEDFLSSIDEKDSESES